MVDRIQNDKEKRQRELEERKRHSKQEVKKNMAEIKAAVEKGRSRPLLAEMSYSRKGASNLDKVKAIKAFVDVLEKHNINPNEHLSEEQKEDLAEHDYVEKMTKEYKKS